MGGIQYFRRGVKAYIGGRVSIVTLYDATYNEPLASKCPEEPLSCNPLPLNSYCSAGLGG